MASLVGLDRCDLAFIRIDRDPAHLKVVIDTRVARENLAGIGQYVTNLVNALAKLPDGPELELLGDPLVDEAILTLGPRCRLHKLPGGYGWTLRARRRFLDLSGDIYHSPSGALVPLLLRQRAVITVHDMTPSRSPQASTLKTRLGYQLLRTAVRSCGRVIAVSQATLDQVETAWGALSNAVIIPEAARPFPDSPPQQRLAEILGSDQPFFLSVGTLQPRKNFESLVAAYELASKGQDTFPDLAIVGKPGWGDTTQLLTAAQARIGPKLKLLGYCSDDDLACLYRHTRAFVLASFDEGFGLPALEAMSFGAPVAVSRRGSLPEVLGEAALYFDPLNHEEIRDKLIQLAIDDDLCRDLSEKSKQRSGQFSWQKTAIQTFELYKSLLDDLGRSPVK